MCPSDEDHLARRKREIIAAAMKVFDVRGYAAATVDEVAAEAGVSKGSMYNYFRSKHDLFVQVFNEATAGGEQRAEQVLHQPLSASEKIHRVLADWFEQLGHYKRIGRLVLEFWATAAREGQEGELAGWFNQKYSTWRDNIAGIVSQGVKDGEFRVTDPQAAAALIVAMVDGVTVQTILDMGLNVDEEFFSSLERAVVTGLKAGPVADEGRR